MWKNILEQDSPQMTTWRKRFACWITKDTNRLRLCNTHFFPTATMVARTRLNVTLPVHRSSRCSLFSELVDDCYSVSVTAVYSATWNTCDINVILKNQSFKNAELYNIWGIHSGANPCPALGDIYIVQSRRQSLKWSPTSGNKWYRDHNSLKLGI
jgi:hypothetical protein